MHKFLQFSDFLGYQPSLLIEGKDRFSTTLSGLISLMVIIITILCTIYFGWDLVFKAEPNVLITNQVYDDFGPVSMSNKGFNFIFALERSNYTYFADSSIFEVSATYIINQNKFVDGKMSQVSEIKQVPIDLCSTFYTDKDILEKNIQFPLDLFYCLKPNEVELRGFWGTDFYSSVIINVNKCVNKTENNNKCKSQEIIDNSIQGSFISFDMTTSSVDQKNYTDPLQRVFANNYNLLNVNSSLFYAYHIYPIVFQSDNGLMMQNKVVSNGWDTKTTLFNIISRTDNIVTFTFEGFATGPVYIRSYVKLQTVMTQVGGFIKAIMIIAKIICHFITQSQYFVHFMAENSIGYATNNTKNKNLSQYGITTHPINIKSHKPIFQINSRPVVNELERSTKVIKVEKKSKTTFMYLCSKIFICKKKSIINSSIDHTRSIFTNYLEVKQMVKSFIEVEESKKLLILMHRKDYTNSLKTTFEEKIELMNASQENK